MDLFTITLISIGLAMDALAVSVAGGFSLKQLRIRHALLIAFAFGFFQALMPIIGWGIGLAVKDYIQRFDHWIAFGLLAFVGGKMVYESFVIKEEEEKQNILHIRTLLLLAVATSIDALAVGLNFAFLEVSLFLAVAIIGLITFILCFLGVYIGNRFGHIFESKLELAGGVILIGMGVKILVEHISQGI